MTYPKSDGPGLLERFVELAEGDDDFCVATVIRSEASGPRPGSKAIFLRDGRAEDFGIGEPIERLRTPAASALDNGQPRTISLQEGGEVFLEVHRPPPRLLICGAGHIAVPLARWAGETGFRVAVLDDRPEYASAERFPGSEVRAGEFIPELRALAPRGFRYVVVITRGHTHDLDCLGEVLRWDTVYIGQIGSRRRLAFLKEELARAGFGPGTLEKRVFGPIGLDIGAETPEELALAIAAEIVCVRRLGPTGARALRPKIPKEAL